MDKLIKELFGKYSTYLNGKPCSFQHIVNTLGCVMAAFEPPEAKKIEDTLRKYKTLLEEFPEFREQQLHGYFPHDGTSAKDYVNNEWNNLKIKN